MQNNTLGRSRSFLTTLLFFGLCLFWQTDLLAQNPGCAPTPGFPDPPASLTCGGETPQAIFAETFDTGFGVFTEDPAPGGSNDLTLSTNGDTPSSSTGSECNPQGVSGPEYIFLEGSSTLAGETHCMSTTIDLTGETTQLALSFWYYQFGGWIGDLTVNVNGTQEFISSGQQQGDQELPWLQADVDLSAYAGMMITLQVCMSEAVAGTGSTWTSDTSIDHIQIFRCPPPPMACGVPLGQPIPEVGTSGDLVPRSDERRGGKEC